MEDVWSNFDLVIDAFLVTIALFVASGVLSLLLGTLLAAMRVGPVPILSKFGTLYVTLFRNTPLLVVFIIVTTAMPNMGWGIPGITIGPYEVSNFFLRAVTALSLYTSAFVCEALRSGINAVP